MPFVLCSRQSRCVIFGLTVRLFLLLAEAQQPLSFWAQSHLVHRST